MALFVLSYDVRSTNHDYAKLYDLLDKWNAAHLQNSVWLVERSEKAANIRNSMKEHMHKDDTIAVLEISSSSGWATRNARKEGSDWLHTHLD